MALRKIEIIKFKITLNQIVSRNLNLGIINYC